MRTYLWKTVLFGYSSVDLQGLKEKHQHTHPPKETYSILAAHYFNTFIDRLQLL